MLLYRIIDTRPSNVFPIFIDESSDVSESDFLTITNENLNLSEFKTPLKYVLVQNSFYFSYSYTKSYRVEFKSLKDEFQAQFINRMRIISYLPKEIQNKIKNKKLFALGYVDKELVQELKSYLSQFKLFVEERIQKYERMFRTDYELKITNQLFKYNYDYLLNIFEGARIKKVYLENDNLYLEMDKTTLILEDAKIFEEECNPNNTYIEEAEIHKNWNWFELHFLLDKLDNSFMDNYYYATYGFKNMRFEKVL